MKRNVIKLAVFLCLGMLLLGLLFLIAGQISKPETPEQTVETTEETHKETETTQPSETVLPTEAPKPVVEENSFVPADFIRDGEWMACKKQPYRLGVDVSKHQGKIDWDKVAAAGVEFAIIRVGGRGYGAAGNLFADEKAQENYKAAKAAGLQVGAYFFSQAISVEEAEAEAAFVLELVKDWVLDLPIVFDWEYVSDTARTAATDAATVTACADTFCQKILGAGEKVMLYVRPEAQMLDLEKLAVYPRWVALYSDTMDYPYRFTMWQYTKTGKVPGISGNVDINIWIS